MKDRADEEEEGETPITMLISSFFISPTMCGIRMILFKVSA